jgi:UDP-glucose 4-epimerase
VPTHPISQYGEDKLKGEVHAADLFKAQELSSIGVRIFNCYGPRQRNDSIDSGVIARFYELAKSQGAVTVFGDGEQTRDFVYVSDVAAFFITAMRYLHKNKPGMQVFNVCTGDYNSLLQLIDALSEILHRKIEVDFQPPRPDSIVHSLGSNARAQSVIGWKPKVAMRDGLKMLHDAGG